MQDKIESPEGAVGGTLGCGTILRIRGEPLLCSLLIVNLRPLRLLPLGPRVSPANSSLCEFAVRRQARQRASKQWEMGNGVRSEFLFKKLSLRRLKATLIYTGFRIH